AGPSRTARTEAWNLAAPQLGVPGRASLLLHFAGAVGGAVLGGLLLARALDGCDRPPEPSAPVVPPAASAASPSSPDPRPPPSAGPAVQAGVLEAVRAQPPRPVPTRDGGSSATDQEMVSMDTARSALASDDIVQALDALDALAKRFPEGEMATSREKF